ncbi:hypothetical protein GCM10017784_35370 [Deinococcus indicus]|uniref:hypothetical protein n=1 Tax=Deinococcus indicus TaxID=223556 RepID=UPI00174DA153|nr:hypothetical protein [Deinococcus indicus]GHG37818.1 hypothetical protein GCM10017784_35370 [Deinococcus indicus]
MTHPTPTVKAPKTRAACACARCGRKLKPGVPHTVTPLGTLGSECEQYAAQALNILHRAGLGILATQGEIRLPGLRHADGTTSAPAEALRGVIAQADRIGLTLQTRFDRGEFVLSLSALSARELLSRRAQGVQA